ncbi:MAG: peptide chain release factor N(5)-glutamine methyltransferase [Treponema sp.]|nr:peptide chain release factor N(5)-glutamine methyltransferase [Treponema sp.]
MTIQEFKTSAVKELSRSPSPVLDVSVMIEHCLKMNRTQVLLNASMSLSEEQLAWLTEAVSKRKTGLPVAYITGHKEFYGYDFIVNPAVLIPKPDTEILVEKALDEILTKMDSHPDMVLSVCDMCTGSGCIGLSVLKQMIEEHNIPSGSLPKLTLCDISGEALEIARQNAKKLLGPEESEEIRFIQTNLFSEVEYTFDLILTNPPYIPKIMVDELLKDGRNEPRLALDGDVGIFGEGTDTNDGLDIIRRLIPESIEHLSYNGILLMETGEYNAEEAARLAEESGYRNVKIFRDLEGQLRVIEGIK